MRIVIVGGGAAGMSAAAQALRRDPKAEVEVYEAGDHVSYGACGIPYLVAGKVREPEELVVFTPERFERERGGKVRVRHAVTEIDLKAKRVAVLPRGAREPMEVRFDKLILATGARPVKLGVPGADLRGIFRLRDLSSGIALRRFVEEWRPRLVVVVGAGFLGLEMAEAFLERGMEVTLLEREGEVMPMLDPEVSRFVRSMLESAGVKVVTGVEVRGYEGKEFVRTVYTEDGSYPADVVLEAVGIRPNTELARNAGLSLTRFGAIRVDSAQETSRPGVYAAGDCAGTKNIVTGGEFWHPLGTTANKTGRVAGDRAAGGTMRFLGVAGTQIAKIPGGEVGRTGLTLKEAREAGFKAEAADILDHSRSAYHPGGGRLLLRLVYDAETGRVLGAQAAGAEGVKARLDVVATALWARMTVGDLSRLDLAYAPPFSPVWDPLLRVAGRVARSLKGG